ncbi:MAG: hypothetical protein JWM76_5164 [Pseudonocardiales bacterium]|nr:hypothetical protein [Pseudonocardiales bacterium]
MVCGSVRFLCVQLALFLDEARTSCPSTDSQLDGADESGRHVHIDFLADQSCAYPAVSTAELIPGPVSTASLMSPLVANNQRLVMIAVHHAEPGLDAGGAVAFCQGHRPVISSSREKLRNVRMSTITPRTATLRTVGVTATVRTMSAATSSSRPTRMLRPSC